MKYIKQHKEKSHSSHLHHKGSNEKEKSIKQLSFAVRNRGITVSNGHAQQTIYFLSLQYDVNTQGKH